jgi:hypothetical protein
VPISEEGEDERRSNFSGSIKYDEVTSTSKQNCVRVNDMAYIRQNRDSQNPPLLLGDKETDFDGWPSPIIVDAVTQNS